MRGVEEMIKVGFKKLTEDAILPVRAHYSDSGFDLFANEDVIIEPGQTEVIKTGVAVKLPPGYEAQVRPRSGVTSKTKLRVQLGTIDNSYVGEIGIIVDNSTEDTYKENAHLIHKFGVVIHDIESNNISEHGFDCSKGMYYRIHKGDKLAQLVVQKLPQVHAYEIDELPTTERGANGFGSSGY